MFTCITSSIECISKFLNAQKKHLEQRKPSNLSSSLNVRCCKLLLQLFGNVFYNASVLKQKKRKCISSLQKCHDQSCPFNNCIRALLSAFNDEFKNSLFINVEEILWSAFECIEPDSYFKATIKRSPLWKLHFWQA